MNNLEIRIKALKLIQNDISLSKEEKNVADLINSTAFGCQSDNVAELMEAWFGKPLVQRNVKIGMFVVPTENQNAHTYTIGHTYFVVQSTNSHHARAIDPKFEWGNNLEWRPSGMRYASAEEIDNFLSKANDKVIDKIKSILKVD